MPGCVAKDGSRVAGVIEPTGSRDSGQGLLRRISVGFGAAEPGYQRSERLATDEGTGLLSRVIELEWTTSPQLLLDPQQLGGA